MPRLLSTYLRLYREACSGLPRATWTLAFVTLVHRAGMMVVPFLSLYFTSSLGFTRAEAGWLLGIWGLGSIGGAYVGGWLSDRVGSVRVQVATMFGNGLGFLVLGQCHSGVTLASALFVIGAVFAAFRPANGATLATTCGPEQRSQAFALHRLALNLGMAIGPAAGGFLASIDYGLLFIVDGSVCVLTALLLAVLMRDPPSEEHVEQQEQNDSESEVGVSPWRDRPFLGLMLVSLAACVIMFVWFAAGPVFLRDVYHMDERGIGLLLALNPVLIVAFEMILVRLLRERHPIPWIGGGVVLLGISCLMLPMGSGVVWACLTVSVWTFGEMMESPLTGAYVANRGGLARVGRYMGVYGVVISIASVVGPAGGLWVYGVFGGAVLWTGAGIVALIAAGGAMVLARGAARGRSDGPDRADVSA